MSISLGFDDTFELLGNIRPTRALSKDRTCLHWHVIVLARGDAMSEEPRPFRNRTAPSISPSSAATDRPAKSSQMTWHGRRKCVNEDVELREPGDSRLSADFHMSSKESRGSRAGLVSVTTLS